MIGNMHIEALVLVTRVQDNAKCDRVASVVKRIALFAAKTNF
jgi:hypothetical protein